MAPVTRSAAPPPLDPPRHRRRAAINALWGLAQAPILLAIVGASLGLATVVGRDVATRVIGRDATADAVPVGLAIGIAVGVYTISRLRDWLHRLRLGWLRRRGDRATAEAVWVIADPAPGLAVEAYLVLVRWRDLAGEHVGDRSYRFRVRPTDDFLTRLTDGRPVIVRYPTASPRRFVIDIPYAPSMADFFI